MENLRNAITLMTPNCFMAFIDLKDAYYSVSVNKNHRKYLRFGNISFFNLPAFQMVYVVHLEYLQKSLKQFMQRCVPKDLKMWATLMTPIFREALFSDCSTNVAVTTKLFTDLGFILNHEKSVFKPKEVINFLGFVLNSVTLTVALTPEKATKLVTKATTVFAKQSPSVREVAELVGLMVASFPGVMLGPLFNRQLELDKVMALRASKGDFNALMTLSETSNSDLQWWITHTHITVNLVSHGSLSVTIYSDAALSGWGGARNDVSTGGLFSEEEQTNHINYLEILACFLTVQTFCSSLRDCHIKAMIDNTTAISYIDITGGRTIQCNELTRKLWLWCIERNLWITATHISGKLNVLADNESRHAFHDTDWKLDPAIFKRVSAFWGIPSIDIFASRLNFQLRPFVSWKPDPQAFAIDAFSISWTEHNFYASPTYNQQGFTEDRTGSITRCNHCPSVDHSDLV
ncbi:uncharacterized protein [Montipora foliosa]|uniref:uncharacterized protein n=1 Tax=Montipora foliosa TaxID=591990 RepID=UPI0035F1E5A9